MPDFRRGEESRISVAAGISQEARVARLDRDACPARRRGRARARRAPRGRQFSWRRWSRRAHDSPERDARRRRVRRRSADARFSVRRRTFSCSRRSRVARVAASSQARDRQTTASADRRRVVSATARDCRVLLPAPSRRRAPGCRRLPGWLIAVRIDGANASEVADTARRLAQLAEVVAKRKCGAYSTSQSSAEKRRFEARQSQRQMQPRHRSGGPPRPCPRAVTSTEVASAVRVRPMSTGNAAFPTAQRTDNAESFRRTRTDTVHDNVVADPERSSSFASALAEGRCRPGQAHDVIVSSDAAATII